MSCFRIVRFRTYLAEHKSRRRAAFRKNLPDGPEIDFGNLILRKFHHLGTIAKENHQRKIFFSARLKNRNVEVVTAVLAFILYANLALDDFASVEFKPFNALMRSLRVVNSLRSYAVFVFQKPFQRLRALYLLPLFFTFSAPFSGNLRYNAICRAAKLKRSRNPNRQ